MQAVPHHLRAGRGELMLTAILITTIISAIAAVMWCLCIAGTDGDFDEEEEDDESN